MIEFDFIGQEVSQKIAKKLFEKKLVPNAILISGEDHHGKSTFALEIAKNILHISSSDKNIYELPNFYPIRSDDRLIQINFLLNQLQENTSSEKKTWLRNELLKEFSDLLSRYQKSFLPFVKEKKNSFIQGVKLTELQREEVFFLCKDIQKSFKEDLFDAFKHEEILGAFEKLQNSIDISMIPSETIAKIIEILKNSGSEPKVIFIEQINKIGQGQIAKLLKILEDTPENVYFILTLNQDRRRKSNPEISPLFSRCFKFFFKSYFQEELKKVFAPFIIKGFPEISSDVRKIQLFNLVKKPHLEKIENFLGEISKEDKNLFLKDFEENLLQLNMEKKDLLKMTVDFFKACSEIEVEKKNKIITILSEIAEKIEYNLSRDYFNYRLYRIFDLFKESRG